MSYCLRIYTVIYTKDIIQIVSYNHSNTDNIKTIKKIILHNK